MSDLKSDESMLNMYIFETSQNIEQLEMCILETEKSGCYSSESVNEIFRIMHTIKGSSAMMLFNGISKLAHSIEDLFYFIREQRLQNLDCSALSDLVLRGVDFFKVEVRKITNGVRTDGDPCTLIESIQAFLNALKKENLIEADVKKTVLQNPSHYYISPGNNELNAFKAVILFEDDCEMENIRAFTVVHNLKEISTEVFYLPEDIIENEESVRIIRNEGFTVYFKTGRSKAETEELLNQTIFLKSLELTLLQDDEEFKRVKKPVNIILEDSPIKVPRLVKQEKDAEKTESEGGSGALGQSIISVGVAKLDKLMDLVGEMVIAEAMVLQNPDLKGLQLDNFQKAGRQLHKITSELQDIVMAVRMVPLSMTFQKMHRIVRDMSRKLGKEVQLELIGEETEVDKNIIGHISDPLMHIVRNSIDHGIEPAREREAAGKQKAGKITIEADNAGSDVLITIKDDGKGLDKEKILERARENGLLIKAEKEMTDKEIYNLIFLPGFSTKDKVTEFSGRGVGMDVVTKNIAAVGGSVLVESVKGSGTAITLKIPLTLAIIDGMNIQVGNSRYTIPTTSIKESFRPDGKDLIEDPDGNEMIMVRGECYPILRLHKLYNVKTDVTDFTKGILIMAEQDEKTLCIFTDELLSQQQVVVKTLPDYMKKTRTIQGLAGCTLLGDGSISLILDIGGLINAKQARNYR